MRTTCRWSGPSVGSSSGLDCYAGARSQRSTPGRLVAFDIRADGSAGPMRVLADLPGSVPDGLAFATDGSVLIACYRPDVIYRWHVDTGLEVVAEDPEGTVLAAPTNCAFVGPDLATVVVPNIGRWHVTRFAVPGLAGVPLFYPTSQQLGGSSGGVST